MKLLSVTPIAISLFFRSFFYTLIKRAFRSFCENCAALVIVVTRALRSLNKLNSLRVLFPLLAQIPLFFLLATPVHAAAGINEQISFQGKVVGASGGTNVANGNYDIEFKIHNHDTNSGGGIGACSGSCLWREAHDNVTVTDGIFRVQLGSVTSFGSSVDWNSDTLYLSIRVNPDGGTSEPEMSPRIRFSAVPYAFNAKQVNGLTVTNSSGDLTAAPGATGALALTTLGNGKGLTLNTATGSSGNSGNITIQTGGTTTSGTSGSLSLDVGAGASSNGSISIGGTNASALSIGRSGAGLTLASGGTSSWANTSGNLTISTASSGNLNLQSVGVLALSTTAGNSNITLAPNGTGAVAITSGVTTGTGTSSALSITDTALSSGSLFDLTSNGTNALTNQKGINISLTGTNGTSGQTTYGGYISNTHDGASSTNIALYLAATSGTSANYALVTNGGNVGFGDTTPDAALEIVNTSSPQFRIGYDDTTNYYTTAVSSAGAVTFDANGSSAGFNFSDPVTETAVNSAGGSATAVTLSGTLGNFDGSDTFRGLYVNYTNGTHSGSSNTVNGVEVASITGSSNATETAVNIGTGWDTAISAGGDIKPSTTNLYNIGSFSFDTTADLTINNPEPESGDGYSNLSSHSTADVNGDGYQDTIVGCNICDAGGADSGSVYIYYGGSSMDSTADVTINNPEPNSADLFGSSVSSADLNGDGYQDVIVGCNNCDTSGADSGNVYIYYGGSSMDSTADVTINNPEPNSSDSFGTSISYAGDVNGDGYQDIIVGCSSCDGGGSGSGSAFVYFGGSSMDTTADLTINNPEPDSSDSFGNTVSYAGDLNGDGYQDVLVGCILCDGGGSTSGSAFVYFGGSVMDSTADVTIDNPEATSGDQFGSVAGIGDLNGDGYSDFMVGCYLCDASGTTDSGSVYVYYGGSSVNSTADVTINNPEPTGNDSFGRASLSSADLNGDGYQDILIGCSNCDASGTADSGSVYIYYGGSSMDTTADVTINNPEPTLGDFFGTTVASVGDPNGDGYQDILIGCSNCDASGTTDAGSAYIYQGTGNRWASTFAQNINLDNSVSIGNLTLNRFGISTTDVLGITTSNWEVDKLGTASFQNLISSGNVGIGDDPSPDATFEVEDNVSEQFRLGYDNTNYASFAVSSAGDLTLTPTGNNLILANGVLFNAGGTGALSYNSFTGSATTSHSLSGDNSLFVEGNFEVDSPTYIDAVNAASGSADALTLSGTLGNFNGSDTFRGLYLNYANGTHSGASNNFYGIDIAGISGSANATETALNIGSGWDTAINISSGQIISSNLGMEFTESDTNPTCSTGNFNIFADLSETNLKVCNNGTAISLVDGDGADIIGAETIDSAIETLTNVAAAETEIAQVDITPATTSQDVYVSAMFEILSSNTVDQSLVVNIEDNATCSGNVLKTQTFTITQTAGTFIGVFEMEGVDLNPGASAQSYTLCMSTATGDTDIRSYSMHAKAIDSGSAVGTFVAWSGITDPSGSQTLSFDDGEVSTWNISSDTETSLTMNANSLTSGKALSVSSTATAFTGALGLFTLSGSNSNNTGNVLGVDNTGTASANTAFYIKHYATGTNNLAMRVDDVSGDTTPFVIDGNGNVGIGDSSPDALLDIASADGTATSAFIDNTSTGDALLGFQISGTSGFSLGIDNSVTGDPFKISKGSALGTTDMLTIDPTNSGTPTTVTAFTLAGLNTTLANAAGANYTTLAIIGPTTNLTGTTTVTAMTTSTITGDTITASAGTTVTDAIGLQLKAPIDSTNATLTRSQALRISDITSGAGTLTTSIGLYMEPLASGATNNYGICFDCDGTWTSSTVAAGLQFGTDANAVNLYRSASDTLRTDDSLSVGTNVTVTGTATVNGSTITFGDAVTDEVVLQTHKNANPATFATEGRFAIGNRGSTTDASGGRIWIRSNNANYRFISQTNALDYSEYMQQEDTSEPGDVMVLSSTQRQSVKQSVQSYDQDVLGVVTKYGTSYADDSEECFDNPACGRGNDPHYANVGMLGQVYTKVSNENGEIKPGDPLATSSVKGVAMKATKQTRILGYALDSFNGSISGKDLFNYLTYPVHDDVAAGKPVKVGKIIILLQAGWFDPGAPKEKGIIGSDDNGKARIVDQSGLEKISFDSSGNAFFAGTLKAKKIEGLEILESKVDQIESLLKQIIASQSAQLIDINALLNPVEEATPEVKLAEVSPSPTSIDLSNGVSTISGTLAVDTLEVKKEALFSGIAQFFESLTARSLIVTEWARFLSDVLFKGDVEFEGRTTFNADTAGIAVIKKDASEVEIKFDKEYAKTPLVTVSISLDETITDEDKALLPPDQLIAKEEAQKKLEDQVLGANIGLIVVKKSTKGFTIRLSKPAIEDLSLSWNAIAVKDPKISIGDKVTEATPLPSSGQTSPAPSPSVAASPSPTPGQVPERSLVINNNEFGFLRVRSDPDPNSEEVGQVNPTQEFKIADESAPVQGTGLIWYKIEYLPEKFGWVSGGYITINE